MNAVASYLKKRFSRSAHSYDSFSSIHREIAEQLFRITELPDIDTPILEIGAGTGNVTRHLGKYYCKDQIVCLDISKKMLEQISTKKLTRNCIQADFHSLPFQNCFSLVISSTSLHWAQNSKTVIDILDHALLPGGTYSIAIMLDGTYRMLNEIKREITGNGPVTLLPDYSEFKSSLIYGGFSISHTEQVLYKESFGSIDEVFLSIHNLGVSGLSIKPLPRGQLRLLKNKYLHRSIESGEDPFLEYQVGFFTGKKAE
jgi:ubiquinone/menaquinone biosynthesis C-methylase UbiE